VKLRRRTRVGATTFDVVGEGRHTYLTIRLPSGRRLFYPRPELREVKTKWGVRVQLTYLAEVQGVGWIRTKTWGGTLTANIDSAIARDLEADAMIRAEDAGLPVVMHTHDELNTEVPKVDAMRAEARLGEIMRHGPAWSAGLPMGAAVFASDYYRK
jgi:DNA polymerase